MRVFVIIVFSVVLYSLLILPSQALSVVSEDGIGKYYAEANYDMVAQLLEQRITQMREKAAADNRTDTNELHRLYVILAHIYAWKLNKFDDALSGYQKAIDVGHAQMQEEENQQMAMQGMAGRQMPKRQMNIPTFEFLFIGGMYEQKKDYQKALEYYQKLVEEAQSCSENGADNGLAKMLQDSLSLVQYQIDGIQLKLKPAKDYKPQLKTLNLLYSANPQFLPLMMTDLLPDLGLAGVLSQKASLQTFIKANPANIHSMLLEYIMLSNVSAGSMSPDVQAGLAAFLDKYPEGYFSLLFRHLMARYYKENGENDKAKRYMKELREIARRRHMELITESDKKFATPETTWDFYRKALCAGDINGALSCHIPGDTKYREVFIQIGPEKVKTVGDELGPLEEINSDTETAKYRIKRLIEGNEITFYVYFVNIYGEWKIRQY